MGGKIRVVPFLAEHLAMIAVQPAQLIDWPDCAARDARAVTLAAAQHGNSFVQSHDQDEPETVVACFGMIESHEQHLTAWAVLAQLSPGQLLFATRWCRAYLARLTVRRIDMVVRGSFAAGHHWAALLGFGHEGVMQRFYPDGDDLHYWAMLDGAPVQQKGAPGWPIRSQ